MVRTLTYSDQAQVTKATMDAVRDIGHSWHDPSSGQYFAHWREQAAIASDGTAIQQSGSDLFDVSLAAQLREVPEADIMTEKANLVTAINDNFPAEWPEVGEPEISID